MTRSVATSICKSAACAPGLHGCRRWRVSGQVQGMLKSVARWGAAIPWLDSRPRPALGACVDGGESQRWQASAGVAGRSRPLDQLTARSGQQGGVVRATGQASLGATPEATLDVQAERFALLQRIDRRILISGQAHAVLGEEDIQLQGKVKVDEGLFDFTRSDAPTVGDDVNVINGPGQTPQDEGAPVLVPRASASCWPMWTLTWVRGCTCVAGAGHRPDRQAQVQQPEQPTQPARHSQGRERDLCGLWPEVGY